MRNVLLCLRGREINYADDTLTLELASEESILQDDALLASAPFTPPGTYLYEIVNYVLALSDRATSFDNAVARDALVDPLLAEWEPGTSAWDYLIRQVNSAGLVLWVSSTGQWSFMDRHYDAYPLLTLTADSNLTGASDTISRDSDWYTAALITYKWTDAADVDHTEYDYYSTPGYPSKVFTLTVEWPYPGPGLARQYCERFITRGQTRTVDAVVDWSTATSQVVDVTLPRGDTYRAAISAATFKYPADTMTLKTRDQTTYF